VRWWRFKKTDADLQRELRSDLELEQEEQRENGLSPEETRYAALRAFGNPTLILEQTRAIWSWSWIESLAHDLRYSLRTLRRSPGFTLMAVVVMTLGIAANTALFTVVRSVLLTPLPFKDPDRLIQLYEQAANGAHPYNYVAGGMYTAWKSQSPSIEQMGIYGTDHDNLSGDGGQLPERIQYAECSWDLFSTLGVQPELGRLFTEQEDSHSAPATVVLTHGLWKRRYGGDKNIIGKTLLLDSQSYTVIGVLPAWFVYPDTQTQLWAAIYHERSLGEMQDPASHNFFVVARLRPGATMAQALSEVDTATKRVHMDHPTPFTSNAANARSLLDGFVQDAKTQLYVLLGATLCVLLIGCVNVANLLVARAASRRKEISIRASLGGGRWKLLREQMTESIVLSLGAGALGLPLALLGVRWLIHSRPDVARINTVHMDGWVVLFAVGVVVLSGVLAGAVPGTLFLRGPLLEALQESSRANSRGSSSTRLRKTLLAVEVALTVILLVCAGLLLKSYQRLRSRDIGCATQNVLTMRLGLPDARYGTQEKNVAFYEELIQRIRALPGVKAAGLSTALPGQGYGGDSNFSIPELPALGTNTHDAMVRGVEPGYFQALQIPLRSGRFLEERERLNDARAVLISESFAHRYFPNESPLGKHIQANSFGNFPSGGFEIVGVVGNTLWSLTEPEGPTMYFPLYYGGWPVTSIGIRSDQNVEDLALPVQKLLAQIDPDMPVSDVLTMEQSIGKSTMDASFTSMLVLAFAVISLLLAAVGLYVVLSYLVAQRRGEIGIRIALGAQREHVLRKVLLDGISPALFGLVAGLAASVVSVRLVRSILYQTQPLDPAVFATVAGVLLLVAIAACFAPAWQAARVDPMQALRME
jgi:predicted permease